MPLWVEIGNELGRRRPRRRMKLSHSITYISLIQSTTTQSNGGDGVGRWDFILLTVVLRILIWLWGDTISEGMLAYTG